MDGQIVEAPLKTKNSYRAVSISPQAIEVLKEQKKKTNDTYACVTTAASTMIANGVDLVTTAAELGHANANTTAMIYAHQIAVA